MQVTQVSAPAGWVDLGIGQPDQALLPLEELAQAAAHRFAQGKTDILQYGAQQGDGNFRKDLAGFLGERYGIPVEADQLLITGGISQALDFVCSLLTQPGDTIL